MMLRGEELYLYCHHVESPRKIVTAEDMISQEILPDSYSSLFYFDNDLRQYVLDNGGEAGFKGKTYGHYFVIDLDSYNLPLLYSKMKRSMDDLSAFPHFVWFSGK